PNLPAAYGPAAAADLGRAPAKWEWPAAWPEAERNRLEGEEVMHTAFAPVAYRDRLGSRITLYKSAGPLDQQAVYRLTDRLTDAPARGDSAARAVRSDADADPRPAPPPEPMEHDHHDHLPGEDAAHA